ncbi:cilia- and flagella-associated protein 45-like isoform X2 [Leptidea sinapis]|nr:cilia- and flagella-associated protein 45-like isoform X2 [Leptidea sinapis]
MELDAIERLRRDHECKQYSDYQLEQRRIQREKERELLKEESKRFKAMWDEEIRKEHEAENYRAEQRKETARERDRMIEEKREMMAQQRAADKLIEDTWDALAGQGRAQEKAEMELRRRKERELDECNREMIRLKKEFQDMEKNLEAPLAEDARRRQEFIDKKRCEYLTWSQKTNRDVRKAMIDQIKDREKAREVLKQKMAEQDEYQRQLFDQLSQLVDHKQVTDAQARKQNQKCLLQQIEYNKLLKERALQEEVEQRKKAQLASEEYDREIKRMLSRPFFSEDVHPFMKQIARGIEMPEKCPCSKSDYCK